MRDGLELKIRIVTLALPTLTRIHDIDIHDRSKLYRDIDIDRAHASCMMYTRARARHMHAHVRVYVHMHDVMND